MIIQICLFVPKSIILCPAFQNGQTQILVFYLFLHVKNLIKLFFRFLFSRQTVYSSSFNLFSEDQFLAPDHLPCLSLNQFLQITFKVWYRMGLHWDLTNAKYDETITSYDLETIFLGTPAAPVLLPSQVSPTQPPMPLHISSFSKFHLSLINFILLFPDCSSNLLRPFSVFLPPSKLLALLPAFVSSVNL